jgi:hypothetical protein
MEWLLIQGVRRFQRSLSVDEQVVFLVSERSFYNDLPKTMMIVAFFVYPVMIPTGKEGGGSALG